MGMIGLVLISLPQWAFFGWMLVLIAILSTVDRLFLPSYRTLAWRIGARGEEQAAVTLGKLEREGFITLYDRRIRKSPANIDAIVVGPPGVFVVEVKNHEGDLRVRGGEIFVRGRRVGDWVAEATREWEAVAAVVSPIPVRVVIHAVQADLPWRRVVVDGIPILGTTGLLRFLRRQPPLLPPREVERVAALIDSALPPRAGPDS